MKIDRPGRYAVVYQHGFITSDFLGKKGADENRIGIFRRPDITVGHGHDEREEAGQAVPVNFACPRRKSSDGRYVSDISVYEAAP